MIKLIAAASSRMQPTAFAVIDKKFRDVWTNMDFPFSINPSSAVGNFRSSWPPEAKDAPQRSDDRLCTSSVRDMPNPSMRAIRSFEGDYEETDRTYIRGIMEMEVKTTSSPMPTAPCASPMARSPDSRPTTPCSLCPLLNPRWGDPEGESDNNDFIVPRGWKLYQKKDFGRYAAGDGKLHACFLANTIPPAAIPAVPSLMEMENWSASTSTVHGRRRRRYPL